MNLINGMIMDREGSPVNDGSGATETGVVRPTRIDDLRSLLPERAARSPSGRFPRARRERRRGERRTGVGSKESLERRHVSSICCPARMPSRPDDADGRVLAEEFTTVGAHAGERPVHGFATSFTDDAVDEVLAWHRCLRSTVVQVYDWMASYTEPLGTAQRVGRSLTSARVPVRAPGDAHSGLARSGAVSHAYAPDLRGRE